MFKIRNKRFFGNNLFRHVQENLAYIIVSIIILVLIMPYLYAGAHSLFIKDDFMNYNVTVQQNGYLWITKAFQGMCHFYKEWEGTYSVVFLEFLLNPLQFSGGGYFELRTIMVTIQIIAYFGLFYVSFLFTELFGIDKRKSVYLVSLILIPLLLYRDYTEIYVWYTGAMAYLLPVIFFCFGFSHVLLAELRKKKWHYALAGVFLFLMSGGVLEFVGFGCLLFLMWVCLDWKRRGKINVYMLWSFVVMLFGALINACAPGNFVRQSTSKNVVGIMGAVFLSLKATLEEAEWLYKNTTFFIFVLFAFLFGCSLARKIKLPTFIMLILGFFLLPIVTIFPIILGVGKMSVAEMANRYLFLLDASIILASICIYILLGSFLRTIAFLPEWKTIVYSVCLIALSFFTVHDMTIVDYNPVVLVHNIYNHTIRDYAKTWQGIYEEIRTSEDKDVVVERELIPDYATGVFYPKLLEDADWWVNRDVAVCYGKDSVRVIQISPNAD